MSRVLALREIAISYHPSGRPAIDVIQHLNVTVDRGEFVVLAGRSGSGKTSLLNVAAGLLRPTHGDVVWSGEIVQTPAAFTQLRRESVGIVVQGGGLISNLTAIENVELALDGATRRETRDRARGLLETLGIDGRRDNFPGQLSGGEQQRVAIARALIRQPTTLLVDEPTANLDRASADGVIAILTGLRTDGRSLLVASHDPQLIERADRVVRLE
jgi:ABC-type lipoprotein export system ATPase subunit